MKNKTRAVLFDLDGTLADTMEDNYQAWRATLAEHGASDLPRDEYFPLEGLNLKELAARLTERLATRPDLNSVIARKEHHYLAKHHFRLYPGVIDLIERLKSSGVKIAIVTTGSRERIEKSIDKDLLEMFDLLITGGDTKRGKPYPDPYLIAASKLGVEPCKCIVIENAPMGIAAAKSAQMYCIAISSTLSPNILKTADQIVGTFADLVNFPKIKELLDV